MSTLFSPLVLKRGQVIKNRLAKAAMSEQLTAFHYPTEPYYQLYRTWALGGAGLMVSGNVMVDRHALSSSYDLVLDDEAHLPLFGAWAAAAKDNGAKMLLQLNHPGKQSPLHICKEPVAPSPLPMTSKIGKFFGAPRMLATDEVYEIVDKFTLSAKLANQAGFDGVQIHAAHGYLINQFLSPHDNRRQDEFGGSLENRARLLTLIIESIKNTVNKDFIIAVKLNSSDFQKGGFDNTDACHVAKMLDALDIDLLEISGGNYENPAMMGAIKQSTALREAYFLEFAKQIGDTCTTPLMVTGGFRSSHIMQAAIDDGAVDLIGLAKPLALLPDLPNRLKNGNYITIDTQAPKTGIAKIDDEFGNMIEMGYYMQQLHQIAKRQPPNPHYPAFKVLADIALKMGVHTGSHKLKYFL